MYSLIFIRPRYPLFDLSVQMSLTERRSADLTDVTLADEDNNSMPTDDVNSNHRQRGNASGTKLGHLVAKIGTNASGAIWWLNL